MKILRKLLIIFFLLTLVANVLAQDDVVDCCHENVQPLGCSELNKIPHMTRYTSSPYNEITLKMIYARVNGIDSECGCSAPYASCGLDIDERFNLRLIKGE